MPPLAQIPNQPRGANDIIPGYGGDSSAMYMGSMRRSGTSGGAPRTGANGRPNRLMQGQDGRWYYADGSPASQDAIDAYFSALANEDRDRFDTDNSYRYDVLKSTDRERAAARQDAKRRLAEEQRQYDATRGDRNHQFDVNTGVDLLKTGAGMRGALDAFQGAAYARGIQTGGLAPYLQGLRTTGTTAYGGGGATTGNPVPLTVGTLANALGSGGTYTPPTGSGVTGSVLNGPGPLPQGGGPATDAYGRPTLDPTYQQNLDAISGVAQKGLSNLGLGAIENMSDDERDTFSSGLSYLGRSPRAEFQMYQRSRPGQRGASLA